MSKPASKETKPQHSTQLLVLSELLSLQERVRPASLQELRFIAVNETLKLAQYEQAVLWEIHHDSAHVTALSGIADVEKNANYTLFLNRLYKHALRDVKKITHISLNDINDQSLREEATEWLPSNNIAIPLHDKENQVIAILLLCRNQPWQDNNTPLLQKIAGIYSYDFNVKQKHEKAFRPFAFLRLKKTQVLLSVLILAALLYPVRLSVLVPAEIIAFEPDLIRAPIDGIIESIEVKPNDKVNAGQTLIIFDKAALLAQKDVSENALKIAQTELRQTSQEAMQDRRARIQLSVLQGRVETEKTNLAYYKDLLSRAEITAPKDGTVIFEDVFDWLGRPVSIGERIMLLAQEERTELEIRLPVHDALSFPDQTEIQFFSNANPTKPIRASLVFHSYRASESDTGEIAYRLKGHWDDNTPLSGKRLGLKGVAKIYGHRKPFILQILRSPLVYIRQVLGI